MQFLPYLNFNGKCREALEFYRQALGGEIVAMHTFGESPGCEGMTAEQGRDLVMHGRLVADGAVIMGSDAPPDRYQPAQGIWVSLMVDDAAESERIFHALSAGGSVEMPIGETFWAERFAMFNDRFGIPWMINCERKA